MGLIHLFIEIIKGIITIWILGVIVYSIVLKIAKWMGFGND